MGESTAWGTGNHEAWDVVGLRTSRVEPLEQEVERHEQILTDHAERLQDLERLVADILQEVREPSGRPAQVRERLESLERFRRLQMDARPQQPNRGGRGLRIK